MDYPLKLSYTTILICLQGAAQLTVNFRTYTLHPNDILVLAEDYITLVEHVSSDFKIFFCLIDRSLAADVAYDLPNQLFQFLHQYPKSEQQLIEAELVQMWIYQINYIKENPGPYQHTLLRNHLQNIFLAIAAKMPSESQNTPHKYSRKEMLCWKFWDLVVKHSAQERNVAFYADKLSITPYYLAQITKSFLNDSPKGLIDRQVILMIKGLLRTTDLPIKAIADQLNFEDTSYMARYFKKQTTMTLTEYRK
ncbi:MAG: helix-turn-helix domain-containing protein [Sphingobacterium sp.]|jgi:AraC-like DNA-binding protein|nr:helix-turn-helix domain-containing protein [Sphingobacterium sp.]